MADVNAVAEQFTNFYYATFDNDRKNLGPLYRDASMMTFEGVPIQGGNSIVEKLVSLPFQSVRHQISTKDAQPLDNSIVISVTGQLLTEGESNPQFFTQTFVLRPEGGNFYVHNDIFRLVYG